MSGVLLVVPIAQGMGLQKKYSGLAGNVFFVLMSNIWFLNCTHEWGGCFGVFSLPMRLKASM